MWAKVTVPDVSMERLYQRSPYGSAESRICGVVYDPVPEAMDDEPPEYTCQPTPDAPFQSFGPKKKGGTLSSGELYTMNPAARWVQEDPDDPVSSILTNACHGRGGA